MRIASPDSIKEYQKLRGPMNYALEGAAACDALFHTEYMKAVKLWMKRLK